MKLIKGVTKVARATAASLLACWHLSDGHHEHGARHPVDVC